MTGFSCQSRKQVSLNKPFFGPAGLGRETQIRPMTSTSEPAQQQASPSPGAVTQDEVTVANPAPLDPAASRADGGMGEPGGRHRYRK